MWRRPAAARAGSPLVLLPAAVVLTLPAYQCLELAGPSEQAQSRQAERAAQLARWSWHCRSQLGRSAGPLRFVAQLVLGSAIERQVCRPDWM